VSPVSMVRTPQETSKPTPPAETMPDLSGSKAATPLRANDGETSESRKFSLTWA